MTRFGIDSMHIPYLLVVELSKTKQIFFSIFGVWSQFQSVLGPWRDCAFLTAPCLDTVTKLCAQILGPLTMTAFLNGECDLFDYPFSQNMIAGYSLEWSIQINPILLDVWLTTIQ